MLKNLLLPSLVIAVVSSAAAQTPAPVVYKNGVRYGAEAQTAPAVYKSAADLMAVLKSKPPAASGQTDSAISNESAYRINVVRRDKPGVAMAHATGPAKGTEVHYIIDGAATVVTGGTIVRGKSTTIENGETHHLTKGDVLVIPAGTPHWYKDVEGTVTYLEVRFDVDKGDEKK